MTTLALPARPPFQFLSVVRSHGWYQLAPNAWDEAAGVLTTVTRLNSGRVLPLAIAGEADGLSVSAPGRLSKGERAELAAQMDWMFNLGADFSAFYALAEAEPRLAHVRRDAHGRFLRSPALFEDVVKVMLTTNIQWAGTRRLAAALVNELGAAAPGGDGPRAFPAPEQIARRRESTLRRLGLGYRAPYLLKLARGVASGAIDLEALREPARPTEDVRRALLALPGIGPYAAATLLGLLGRYDYIGVDTEAVSAVSQAFYAGRPVGEKEVNAVFARWGPFKTLAYWFWDWSGKQQAPMEAWEERAADG
jgi:3-methyladenine DNA glycosylase/8-oxoguanine DNA glycosylase